MFTRTIPISKECAKVSMPLQGIALPFPYIEFDLISNIATIFNNDDGIYTTKPVHRTQNAWDIYRNDNHYARFIFEHQLQIHEPW